VRHLQEQRIGQLFLIVAVTHAVIVQRMAEIPDFLDERRSVHSVPVLIRSAKLLPDHARKGVEDNNSGSKTMFLIMIQQNRSLLSSWSDNKPGVRQKIIRGLADISSFRRWCPDGKAKSQPRPAGQGRAGQGRAGQGRAGAR
jgi:hypothetical protein